MNENKINVKYDPNLVLGKNQIEQVLSFLLSNIINLANALIVVLIIIAIFQSIRQKSDKTGFLGKQLIPLLIMGGIVAILQTSAGINFFYFVISEISRIFSTLKF